MLTATARLGMPMNVDTFKHVLGFQRTSRQKWSRTIVSKVPMDWEQSGEFDFSKA